jgi:hypothetical protein
MASRKYQPIFVAVLLVAALLMAAGNFGSLGAHFQKAYAMSGNLDASTCTGADNAWDEGSDTCTVGGTLEADRAGTLTIPSGTTLAVGPAGSLAAGSSSIAVAENGTIDNKGAIQVSRIAFTNNGTINNNGTISIGDGFLRNNLEGTINNEPDGVINSIGDFFNSGTINNEGTIDAGHMDNSDSGIIDNQGTITGPRGAFTGTIPTSGNPIEYPDLPLAYSMSINSADLSGNLINGVWTMIRSESGPDAGLFTPILFHGDPGATYNVTVADYAGRVFHHWDDGSTERARAFTFANGTTLTAYFDMGDSLRGFAPLTYTGTDEQPDLTVNATSLDGSRTLRMWTIIDPQPSKGPDIADSVGEPTITISSDTDQGPLVVEEDDVLLIESGVTVGAETLENHGTIINRGTLQIDPFAGFDCGPCPPGTYPAPVANEGLIENYGYIALPGHGTTYNNGTIVVKEGGSISLARTGSAQPGKLVNGEDGIIDNFGTVTAPLYGNHRVSVENNGEMYKECTGTYNLPSDVPGPGSGIFTGNPIVDACDAGTTYKVYASNYGDRVFDHWEDGSTERIRMLTIEEATTITAYYRTG